VKFDELAETVRRRAELDDPAEAERTVVAVVQALADRLTGKEARDLLAQLPYRLKTSVVVSPSPQPLSAEDFVNVVARDLEVEPDEARRRIRAVFATLREAVSWGEFEDVLSELDPEYADLLA
jgi:uncharacterized protein (DUF2267 family)